MTSTIIYAIINSVLKNTIEYEIGRVPEWPKGADCKSAVSDFSGSNPLSPTSENPHPTRDCGFSLFLAIAFMSNRVQFF